VLNYSSAVGVVILSLFLTSLLRLVVMNGAEHFALPEQQGDLRFGLGAVGLVSSPSLSPSRASRLSFVGLA
jgi:hypothetical protein